MADPQGNIDHLALEKKSMKSHLAKLQDKV